MLVLIFKTSYNFITNTSMYLYSYVYILEYYLIIQVHNCKVIYTNNMLTCVLDNNVSNNRREYKSQRVITIQMKSYTWL